MHTYSILQAVQFTKKKHGFQRQIFCAYDFGLGFNPLCLSFLICKFRQRKLPF